MDLVLDYILLILASNLETMGLTIPNSSSNPSLSSEKLLECDNSQIIIERLLVNDIKPLDIITRKSVLNAVKMLYLTGGSNGVIHLLSIAREANVELTLSDFKSLQDIPVLLNMKPHGANVMYDLHKLGGLSSFIKYLIIEGILDGDCITVTGNSLKENVSDADDIDFKIKT